VALGRQLRAAGLRVTPDRSATFAAACALLPRDRDAHYWAARLVFVARREDLPIFDAVFAAVVDGLTDPAGADRGDAAAVSPPPSRRPRSDAERHAPPQGEGDGSSREPAGAAGDAEHVDRPGAGEPRRLPVGSAAADTERLAGVRLDQLDESELALVARYVRRLAIATPPRRARRASASRRGEHLDVRSTVRRSLRTGGDPVVRLHRRRHQRPRPLVALLDVSGSMAPYARAYLLLLEGARAEPARRSSSSPRG
jgi:uncharacterized protein with von Willebrand factor type A (vWA) domain